MEQERVIGIVSGLGTGSILGFSVTVTNHRLIFTDSRKMTFRAWLSMMIGLAVGVSVVLLVLFSGISAIIFRLDPLLSIMIMLALVFATPMLTMLTIPRLLRNRLGLSRLTRIQAEKKDIIKIDSVEPSTVSGKGYFTISMLNGPSIVFWTIDRHKFDTLRLLLGTFAPAQMGSGPSAKEEYYTGYPVGDPTNRATIVLASVVVLLTIAAGIFLWSSQPGFDVIGIVLTAVIVETVLFATRSLRNRRGHRH